MKREGTALGVATVPGKRAGCGTRNLAGRADRDGTCLYVAADAGQVKFQVREFGHC
jgi:hypothetical protein